MVRVFGVMLERDTYNHYAQIVLAKTAEEAVEKRRAALKSEQEKCAAEFKARGQAAGKEAETAESFAKESVLIKVEMLHHVNIE
jgi:hypothetical protein